MTGRERLVLEHVRDRLSELAEWPRLRRWELEGELQVQANHIATLLQRAPPRG